MSIPVVNILKNLEIQDGSGRHLEKSPYLHSGLTNFNKIWHGNSV